MMTIKNDIPKASASISLDMDSGIPIWLQLRNRLIYLITAGVFHGGDRLPTVREMAVDLNINYNTVSKVYQDIERDGYIMSKRGKGTFVLHSSLRTEGLGSPADVLALEFIRHCKEIGVPESDIANLVQRNIAKTTGVRIPHVIAFREEEKDAIRENA